MNEKIQENELAIEEIPDGKGVTEVEELEPIEESVAEESSDGEGLREDIDKEREALKAEISRLEQELEKRTTYHTRYMEEIREFSEVFGRDSLERVPESVWKSMEDGVPLAAAYALYEKKNAKLLEKAEAVNKKNASMSAGAIGGAAERGFYSPDEVRAMSAQEVKKNYNLIIESMKKWN